MPTKPMFSITLITAKKMNRKMASISAEIKVMISLFFSKEGFKKLNIFKIIEFTLILIL
jgi:hypothetical protein